MEAVNSMAIREPHRRPRNQWDRKEHPRLLFPWDLLYDTAKATNRRARRFPSTASMRSAVPRKAYTRFHWGEQKGHERELREIGAVDGPEPFVEYKLRSGFAFAA